MIEASSLDIQATGKASVKERGELVQDQKWYESIDLVEVAIVEEEIHLAVFQDDDGTVTINLHANNLKNSETSRIFHTDITADLSWEDMKVLHRYLGFLLETHKIDR